MHLQTPLRHTASFQSRCYRFGRPSMLPAGAVSARARADGAADLSSRSTSDSKSRIQKLFERRSVSYDKGNTFHPPLCQELVRMADITAGSEVLDVCCGTGLVAYDAAAHVGRSGRVVGVDITQSMIDKAVAKMKPNLSEVLSFQCADVEQVQFPAGSFSHVLVSNGMAYLSDIAGSVSRFKQWLKPGGMLGFNNPQAPMIPLTALIIDLARDHFGITLIDGGCWLGSPKRIRTVLEAADYENIQVAETAKLMTRTGCTPRQYAENVFELMRTFPTSPMELQLDQSQIDELRRLYMEPAVHQASEWATGEDITVPYTMLWATAVKRKP